MYLPWAGTLILIFGVGYFVMIEGAKGLAYLRRLRTIIENNRRKELHLRPGTPREIAHLDLQVLQSATDEMIALGFEWLKDDVSRTLSPPPGAPVLSAPIPDPALAENTPAPRFVPEGFARVFVHRGHGCFGRLIFVAVHDREGRRRVNTTFLTAINSIQGSEENDWSYATSNRDTAATANAIMKLWRKPRRLFTRLPGQSAEQVLEFHLRRRADIAACAGIAWKPDLTIADNLQSEQRTIDNMRTTFQHMTPLKMAWLLYKYKREPLEKDREWLGALAGRLRCGAQIEQPE